MKKEKRRVVYLASDVHRALSTIAASKGLKIQEVADSLLRHGLKLRIVPEMTSEERRMVDDILFIQRNGVELVVDALKSNITAFRAVTNETMQGTRLSSAGVVPQDGSVGGKGDQDE